MVELAKKDIEVENAIKRLKSIVADFEKNLLNKQQFLTKIKEPLSNEALNLAPADLAYNRAGFNDFNKMVEALHVVHLAICGIDVARQEDAILQDDVIIHPFSNTLKPNSREMLLQYASEALVSFVAQFDLDFNDTEKAH